MIRINGHLGKINFGVFSDFQLFSLYQKSTDIRKLACPYCGAVGCCSYFASYKRYLITVENDSRVDYTVTVGRVLCSSCHSTHALLPDILIPFGSYSLSFILYILNAYLSRTGSVEDFCNHWQISVSTLYFWIHTFENHYGLFFGILNRLQKICLDAIHKVSSFPFLTSDFFERFHFSFLQNHKTSGSELFIPDS